MSALALRQTVPATVPVPRSFETPDVRILRDMQGWRDTLAAAERSEVGAALVSTAFAARSLKTIMLAAQGFPGGLLHGRAAPTSGALAGLTAYVEQLCLLCSSAQRSPERLHRLAAPGLDIIGLSLQSVMHRRQLLAEGQALWRELVRGIPDYPVVYRQLLGPGAGAEEIADDLFLPAALVPIAA